MILVAVIFLIVSLDVEFPMTEVEMINFFKDQIRLEYKIIKSLTNSLKNVKNPVVKQVLRAIVFDSKKHADLYNAALSIETVTPALTDKEYRLLKEITEKHIADEEEAITALERFMPNVKSSKISLLLESIATDEKKHHELLNKIIELIVKREAITEEDWWEILWKNVPFHGAPGG